MQITSRIDAATGGRTEYEQVCDENPTLGACRVDFFFFQAEDGIRDVAVTGVQTCALPISCLAHCLGQTAGALLRHREATRKGILLSNPTCAPSRRARAISPRTSGDRTLQSTPQDTCCLP